jgi:hypothetical protein
MDRPTRAASGISRLIGVVRLPLKGRSYEGGRTVPQ